MQPKISLSQWRALVAVVEAGGYAAAAERLHRAQSTLTYAVQTIERLLGLKVFTIQGRKAQLTPGGQVLYRRARVLLDEARALEQGASSLAAGWEAEIGIAVEPIFPTWLLLECFGSFFNEHPDIRIELHESVLGGTDELLQARRVDFAIASQVPAGFMGDPLMQLRAIAAAAPSHPLHQLGRELTADDLRRHRHLVVRDTGSSRSRQVGWLGAEQRLTVSDMATAIAAAGMGLGYAWYSEELIRQELERGALKPLPLREGAEHFGVLYLVFADRDYPGLAAARLAAIIRDRVRRCGAAAPASSSNDVAAPAARS